MESCLASRKAKRRAAARPRTGEKGSPPPAPCPGPRGPAKVKMAAHTESPGSRYLACSESTPAQLQQQRKAREERRLAPESSLPSPHRRLAGRGLTVILRGQRPPRPRPGIQASHQIYFKYCGKCNGSKCNSRSN